MTDTPDDLLARVRAVSRRTFMSNGLDDRRAVEAFADLDRLLSSGGPLPAAWAGCDVPARPVTDVLGPEIRPGLDAALASLVRALNDRDSEISRLTAELDATRNVPVEYVITAGLEAAMAADPNREDGAVIRVTDGQRKAYVWKATARTWEQVP